MNRCIEEKENINTTIGSNTAVVKTRVEYIQPSNAADLPSIDTTFASTVSFDYAQAY